MALQILRHLVTQKFKFHSGVQKCYFVNFSERTGMAMTRLKGTNLKPNLFQSALNWKLFSAGPKESLTGIKETFLFSVCMNNSKAKIERPYSNFRAQSG